MRTYYIVKHSDRSGVHWYAHKKGFHSLFDIYNDVNSVAGTYSLISADDCERSLMIDKKKPQVIGVVKR